MLIPKLSGHILLFPYWSPRTAPHLAHSKSPSPLSDPQGPCYIQTSDLLLPPSASVTPASTMFPPQNLCTNCSLCLFTLPQREHSAFKSFAQNAFLTESFFDSPIQTGEDSPNSSSPCLLPCFICLHRTCHFQTSYKVNLSICLLSIFPVLNGNSLRAAVFICFVHGYIPCPRTLTSTWQVSELLHRTWLSTTGAQRTLDSLGGVQWCSPSICKIPAL